MTERSTNGAWQKYHCGLPTSIAERHDRWRITRRCRPWQRSQFPHSFRSTARCQCVHILPLQVLCTWSASMGMWTDCSRQQKTHLRLRHVNAIYIRNVALPQDEQSEEGEFEAPPLHSRPLARNSLNLDWTSEWALPAPHEHMQLGSTYEERINHFLADIRVCVDAKDRTGLSRTIVSEGPARNSINASFRFVSPTDGSRSSAMYSDECTIYLWTRKTGEEEKLLLRRDLCLADLAWTATTVGHFPRIFSQMIDVQRSKTQVSAPNVTQS